MRVLEWRMRDSPKDGMNIRVFGGNDFWLKAMYFVLGEGRRVRRVLSLVTAKNVGGEKIGRFSLPAFSSDLPDLSVCLLKKTDQYTALR